MAKHFASEESPISHGEEQSLLLPKARCVAELLFVNESPSSSFRLYHHDVFIAIAQSATNDITEPPLIPDVLDSPQGHTTRNGNITTVKLSRRELCDPLPSSDEEWVSRPSLTWTIPGDSDYCSTRNTSDTIFTPRRLRSSITKPQISLRMRPCRHVFKDHVYSPQRTAGTTSLILEEREPRHHHRHLVTPPDSAHSSRRDQPQDANLTTPRMSPKRRCLSPPPALPRLASVQATNDIEEANTLTTPILNELFLPVLD